MVQDMVSSPGTSRQSITNLKIVNAMAVNMAMSFMAIIFATILRFHLKALNRKLDRGEAIEDVNVDGDRRNAAEEQGLPGIAADNGFRFLM